MRVLSFGLNVELGLFVVRLHSVATGVNREVEIAWFYVLLLFYVLKGGLFYVNTVNLVQVRGGEGNLS